MSLIETFVEAINTATRNMADYKEAAKNYTEQVDSGLDELDGLIKRLSGCIKQLVDLQQDYNVYIQRISRIRLNMQTMLDQQITQAQTDSGEDCDNKIRGLLEKFNAFVQTIGTWEKEGGRFRELLDKLTKEIDKLCEKANQIIMENEDNQGGRKRLEREISELEAKLGQGNQDGDGASKQQPADSETKGGEPRAQMEVEPERRRQQPRQSRQFSRSTPEGFDNEQKRQKKINELRRAGIPREDKISEMRSWDRDNGFFEKSRNATEYNNLFETGRQVRRGGWQTPEKLASISRYSPIRRINKKKNTKKNKKNKRKRNRRKQTKKRRRKRN
tara:strand:- start:35 stop:1027 length:993 start_codon:yes stop_codon:yes gene_type:complete